VLDCSDRDLQVKGSDLHGRFLSNGAGFSGLVPVLRSWVADFDKLITSIFVMLDSLARALSGKNEK
jgi:hypothetical protein